MPMNSMVVSNHNMSRIAAIFAPVISFWILAARSLVAILGIFVPAALINL